MKTWFVINPDGTGSHLPACPGVVTFRAGSGICEVVFIDDSLYPDADYAVQCWPLVCLEAGAYKPFVRISNKTHRGFTVISQLFGTVSACDVPVLVEIHAAA